LALLKLALGVISALLGLLVGAVTWFMRSIDSKVGKMGSSLDTMGREYAAMKTVVDSLEKRVTGVADNHGPRIATLEIKQAGQEHDITNVKEKLMILSDRFDRTYTLSIPVTKEK
jgi:hypothetical protein